MQDQKYKTFLTEIEPRKHHLFNIYQFRQLTQEKEESYDDFATRLKLAAGPCDFPTDWRDVEIQLQLIEKGKSVQVRRRLLSKPHTLTEALDFARAQEMSDKQAERIETDRQSHGTDTSPEENYIRLDNRHKARRLERCVCLVVELFCTPEGG